MTTISGRIAVLTGGASGIGRGIAEQLIANGATVVIADIEHDALAATAAEIGAVGMQVDVRDLASVRALGAAVIERFGAVHIVVNNAGVASLSAVADMTVADWTWLFGVNLFGVVHGIEVFLPLLEQSGVDAHLVNTGSMAGFAGDPGLGGYSATKAAIGTLTEVLSAELREAKSNVHVTLLAPGPVNSNLGSSSRNRAAGEAGGLHDVDLAADDTAGTRWMPAADVGRVVVRAIRANDEFAITHPDWWPVIEKRTELLRAAFAKYPVLKSEG